ncbi:MAG: hypothetical protein ACOVOV_00925 [Dolichospermum sp.]
MAIPVEQSTRRVTMKQPTTPPPTSSTNVVKNLIDNHKTYMTPIIPTTAKFADTKKMTDFYTILNPDERPSLNLPEDTDVEPENISIRKPYRSEERKYPFKATKDGLPNKRSKDYAYHMETFIGAMPPEERTKKQQQAYDAYLNSLTKPSANDTKAEIIQPQQAAAVKQIKYDMDNEEEE